MPQDGVPHKLPKTVELPFSTFNYNAQEAWRVFGIISEFVAASEKLNRIRPGVTIFGSARVKPGHQYYDKTEKIARLLSDAGFSVISGGGPGIMEAANKGAFYGKSPAVGLNIALPLEQKSNPYQDISVNFDHFFSRKVMFVRFATAYVLMPLSGVKVNLRNARSLSFAVNISVNGSGCPTFKTNAQNSTLVLLEFVNDTVLL